MCGIFAIFSSSLDETELRNHLIKCSSSLRHRGPDWSGYIVVKSDPSAGIPLNHGIAHERLAIMDPESGSQPLVSRDGNVIVAANGEIYNYKELFKALTSPYTPATGSDCEVILPLWAEFGPCTGRHFTPCNKWPPATAGPLSPASGLQSRRPSPARRG